MPLGHSRGQKAGDVVVEMAALLDALPTVSNNESESAMLAQTAQDAMKAIEEDDTKKLQSLLEGQHYYQILTTWVGIPYMATPMELVCKKGTRDLMKCVLQLLPNSLVFGQLPDGFGPIHHSVVGGNMETLQEIIDRDLTCINSQTVLKQTPLHLAARSGHEHIVKHLLNEFQSIDVDPRDHIGETPLSMAATNGHIDIVTLLLTKNANVNSVSTYGMTPLLGAACKGHLKIAMQLLECGADALARDTDKDTALHFLRTKCSPELLTKLLQRGALLGAANKLGLTALQGLPPDVLQTVLDNAITIEKLPDIYVNKHLKDEGIVRFSNPFQSPSCHSIDLINFLSIYNSKKHEHLVFHPLFRALIDFKWQGARNIFFVNVALLLCFVTLITAFVFMAAGKQRPPAWLLIVLSCFIIVLTILRVYEMKFCFSMNYRNLHHWLEIVLLVLSTFFLCFYDLQFLGVAVLLTAWLHAFVFVSKHPSLSPLFYIFCYISKSFVTFLFFSIWPLVGFILAFHVVFKDCPDNICEENVFATVPKTVLKIAAMMIGELEYGSFPLGHNFAVWSPILAAFIFLICFVLFNMMNGLAVSDTQDLRKRAQFSTTGAQVEMILSRDYFIKKLKYTSNLNRFSFFELPVIDSLQVLPSNGQVLPVVQHKSLTKEKQRFISVDIAEEAKVIIEQRRDESNLSAENTQELRYLLEKLKSILENLTQDNKK